MANEIKSTSASHQYAVEIGCCWFKKTKKQKLTIKNGCLPSPRVPLADMSPPSPENFWEMWPCSCWATKGENKDKMTMLKKNFDCISERWNYWGPYRESSLLPVVVRIQILLKLQHAEFHFFQKPIRHYLQKKRNVQFNKTLVTPCTECVCVWELTVSASINRVGHSEQVVSIWEDLKSLEPRPLRPSPR